MPAKTDINNPIMSTATLSSLLEYLYGTLSPSNMRWVGEHLIEHAKKEEQEETREQLLDRFVSSRTANPAISEDEIMDEVRAVRYAK